MRYSQIATPDSTPTAGRLPVITKVADGEEQYPPPATT